MDARREIVYSFNSRPCGMRLRSKATLAFLPLAAAFIVVVTVASRRGIEGIVLEEAVSRVRPQAVELAARLAPHFAARSERSLLPPLQAAQSQTGAEFAAVLDAAGRVLAHTNVLEVGKIADASPRADGPQSDSQRVSVRGVECLVLYVPIREPLGDLLLDSRPGRRLGELRIGLPIAHSLNSARRIADVVAALVALFCVLSLAAALGVLQWLLGPVRQMSDATVRVASGDYEVLVPVDTNDEVGELAASFNRMSATLARTTVSRDQLARALGIASATIEASSDGILVYDLEGSALTHNRRFLEMWDLTPELVAQGRAAMMAHVVDRAADPQAFRERADELSQLLDQEHVDEIRLKSGRVFERTVRPLLLNGAVFARVLRFRDMTAINESAQVLERARDAAVQAARIKSEFLANMSHELRTPLNAVVGSAELLRHSELSPDQRERVEVVSKSAGALLDLVNGVLDFSKIEAGRMTAERIPFRLRELLENAATIARSRAAEKDLELACDLVVDAGEVLLGDPLRLRQILLNLLDNAVKFTETGHVRLGAKLAEVEKGVLLEIAVEDSGIGIDPEALPRLFTAFTQADSSTTRRYGGTGLGLTISKSLVELLGGSIGAESALGVGSTFRLRIPFERAGPGTVPGGVPSRAGAAARRDRQRVLVVEDNAINRNLLLMQIEKLGRPVAAVSDGAAFLEALGREDYGMVLMDCQMPGLDGYEATRRVREREGGKRRVPIAAFTAHAGEADRAMCLAAGMDDYLAKPATLEDLAVILDRWDRPFDEVAFRAYAGLAAPDPAALRALVDGFVLDASARLDRARAAYASGDRASADAEVHALKGAAASLGARGLRELCRRLEASASGTETGLLLSQADVELDRIRRAVPSMHA
ncbi:MAG: ATP-binding protein [Elusimicrobiota bacterium]|nr:MAG: ATP-binding protein [Elusimicrobiota bacterium]